MKLEMATGTDTGLVREHNEDNLFTQPGAGLAILADGMGGHLAGEVASDIAIQVISAHLGDSPATGNNSGDEAEVDTSHHAENLVAALQAANTEILDTAERQPECTGMGATVVVATFHDTRFSAIHLGDSRLYCLRAGQLEQLTEDHTLVQELVQEGLLTPEEAQVSLHKNLITRALGVSDVVKPGISEGALEEGDIFLLCSDGLSDVVSAEQIVETLEPPAIELEAAVARLIDLANEAGGPDNITVILVRILTLES